MFYFAQRIHNKNKQQKITNFAALWNICNVFVLIILSSCSLRVRYPFIFPVPCSFRLQMLILYIICLVTFWPWYYETSSDFLVLEVSSQKFFNRMKVKSNLLVCGKKWGIYCKFASYLSPLSVQFPKCPVQKCIQVAFGAASLLQYIGEVCWSACVLLSCSHDAQGED